MFVAAPAAYIIGIIQLATCVTELCVASRSADAAVASAYWAGAAFWIAAIGLALSGITLLAAIAAVKFARDAATENRRSADAAIKAARLSEDALALTLASDRPWVVLEDVTSGRRHDPRHSETFFGVAITLRIVNCGIRPALNGSIEWQYVIQKPELILPQFELFSDRFPVGAFVIGPGKTHNSETIKLDAAQAADVLDERLEMFVAFRVVYEGSPGTRYRTQGVLKMRSIMTIEAARSAIDQALFAPDLIGQNTAT